jgi:hypothetical protein
MIENMTAEEQGVFVQLITGAPNIPFGELCSIDSPQCLWRKH